MRYLGYYFNKPPLPPPLETLGISCIVVLTLSWYLNRGGGSPGRSIFWYSVDYYFSKEITATCMRYLDYSFDKPILPQPLETLEILCFVVLTLNWHLNMCGETRAIDFLEFGRLSFFKGNYCHLHAIFGDCFEFSIAPYKTVACEKWRFSSKWLDRYHEVIRLLSKIENTAKKSNLLIFLAEDDLFSLFRSLVWICDSSLYDSGFWNMLE